MLVGLQKIQEQQLTPIQEKNVLERKTYFLRQVRETNERVRLNAFFVFNVHQIHNNLRTLDIKHINLNGNVLNLFKDHSKRNKSPYLAENN